MLDSLQNPDERAESAKLDPNGELVTWIMSKVSRWRTVRDGNYSTMWDRYYSIWRGRWHSDLKGKSVERSRLIAPATQTAVDQTVAEMTEAVFGRGDWFDLSEDLGDTHAQQIAELQKEQLLEDFAKDRIKATVIECFQLGAVYGTGIAKRIIDEKADTRITKDEADEPMAVDDRRVSVSWQAIPPYNFVIDSSALHIESALGCAHETVRPLHEITDKQRSGEFQAGDVQSASGYGSSNVMRGGLGEAYEVDPTDGVYITEYHGKVPSRLLELNEADEDSEIDVKEDADEDTRPDGTPDIEEYVEAIVTIGNGSTLLKAVENPILGGDRGFISYQHNKSPNRFWGIGVAEKAFNSQVALDAEIRARIDALGLITYPVVGADATRLPRNLNLTVSPGKVYMTNGRPSEIIEALKFGNLDPVSFQQSGDMERMVQSATGALDPATPINAARGANDSAGGQSMQQGSVIKRAKLTMQNVDTDFLDPLVRKSLLAYITLDSDRYPRDIKFRVNSTMSIMAREFEQMQMTNLLAIIPQESPAFNIILKGIVENYSGPSKDKIMQAIDEASKPNPEQQQMQHAQGQLTLAKMKGDVDKLNAEIQKIQSDIQLNNVKGNVAQMKAHHEGQQLDISAAQTVISNKTVDAQNRALDLQERKLHQDNVKHSLDHAHDVNSTIPADKQIELAQQKNRVAAFRKAGAETSTPSTM